MKFWTDGDQSFSLSAAHDPAAAPYGFFELKRRAALVFEASLATQGVSNERVSIFGSMLRWA